MGTAPAYERFPPQQYLEQLRRSAEVAGRGAREGEPSLRESLAAGGAAGVSGSAAQPLADTGGGVRLGRDQMNIRLNGSEHTPLSITPNAANWEEQVL